MATGTEISTLIRVAGIARRNVAPIVSYRNGSEKNLT
jgi:hypothetical protein